MTTHDPGQKPASSAKRTVAIALVIATLGIAALLVNAGGRAGEPPDRTAHTTDTETTTPSEKYDGDMSDYQKPSDRELQERLSPDQYKVTQHEGTERPFQNEFWDNKAHGLYVDVVSGEPLFSSIDKFKSGSGWPSFTRPLVEDHVVEREDSTLLMRRVEVRSRYADSHLGHVFDDGPQPTGQRYCINSAALRFVPVERLAEEGYDDFLAAFAEAGVVPAASVETVIDALPGNGSAASAATLPGAGSAAAAAGASTKMTGANAETAADARTTTHATATMAGGCFWGVEDLLRELPGVLETQVGYTGGSKDDPTYRDVSSGRSGHAEALQIVFDPAQVSYADILRYFFRLHDPTTKNRQGNDKGTQYRSAIFYHDEDQRLTAELVKAEEEAGDRWTDPIVTEIVPASDFYDAETYHQDYLEKNPGGYTCHFLRD